MAKGFRLVRYFTVTSVGMFVLVAAVLAYFEREQAAFIHAIQRQEIAFVEHVQDGFARQQDAGARDDLLAAQERANVEIARLFANSLWERHFGPFVELVGTLPADACRAIPDLPGLAGQPTTSPDKRACFAALGERIRALPQYPTLQAKVIELMQGSSVFKIKVFDLHGLTVYSTDPAQVGEDKARNAGWKDAVSGTPRSELTHRDRFSGFEGVVENRDLISSYLPMHDPHTGDIVGVFELYSDVTPLLAQVRATSLRIAQTARANQARMEQVWNGNLDVVEAMSWRGPAIVAALLAVLFAALFIVVRRAGAILAQQERAREKYAEGLRRENAVLAENARLREDVERLSRHDLKTPLNSVIGVARLLQDDPATRPEQRELLAIAERAGYRMLEMVNLSLDLARMELGSYEFRPQAVDLVEVAGRVLQDLHAQAQASQVQVVLQPAPGGPHYARAEELLCYSLLANVVKNAIEASPAGGTVTITLAAGDPLCVRIHNDGRVPAEVASRFFEKYATAGKDGGTGLGTYSARLMARVQHGELVMVTGDAGTELTLTLPAMGGEPLPAPPPARAGASAVAGALPASSELAPCRVLAVDDDEYNLVLLRRYLPSPPLALETVETGTAAVEAAARHWPDVMLLDAELPGLDGFEVAAWMRAREREAGHRPCRIMMMSSHDDAQAIRRAYAAGVDRYLPKPFTREALLGVVRELQRGELAPALPTVLPAAPPPAPHLPVRIDPQLRQDVPAFLASRVRLVDAMAGALDDGDRGELHKVAHRAAGGLALFGFEWAAWQSRRISVRAGEADEASLRGDIESLREHLHAVKLRLEPVDQA